MAAGNLVPSPLAVRYGTYSLTAPHEQPPWQIDDQTAPAYGTLTDTQPIDENDEARSAQIIECFGFGHWYNRIHAIPREIDLGNLVSTQLRTFIIWNAYTVSKTLDQILESGADDLILTQPSTPPLLYAPLLEYTYEVQIGTEGSANVDALYSFAFGLEVVTVHITGSRIIAWTFRPDWGKPMIERLDWATDVLRSYDGVEQRIKLLQYPRRTLEFGFMTDDLQRRKLETALYGWGARNWAVPIWPDGQDIPSDAFAGGSTIPVDTAGRDYRVGGLVMLLAADGTYEVHEIDAFDSSTVTIPGALAYNWPNGSGQVFPVRLARLPSSQTFSRWTHQIMYGTARFETMDANDWPAVDGATTYLGYSVLTEKSNQIEDTTLDYERILESLDWGGARRYNDRTGVPDIRQTFRWTLVDKDELADFRSWLYARAGRLNPVWLPTWSDDLVVVATVASAATSLDIENIGYTGQINGAIHRQDIRIEMQDGTVYYRRISGGQIVSDTVERVLIDSQLGTDYEPEDFKQISFMSLVRLDSDGVELAYFTGQVAECVATLRGAGHVI